jgi:C-methyltransferase C-terminal domain/Putative zinc binding domain/Methyltransferase domain
MNSSTSLPSLAQNLQTCRFCDAQLKVSLVDLGVSPLCESFRTAEQQNTVEHFYPLHPRVCGSCLLVQVPSFVPVEDIFREYAYYSAFSTSWLTHCEKYVNEITERLSLDSSSFVCELASNDGYLLQYFVSKDPTVASPKILGVEPAYNCAKDAEARGVPTVTEFFTNDLAKQLVQSHGHADLIIGNNVLAQIPELNDFVAGIATLISPTGTLTLEWPHLLRLIEENQFDTIYHEHFGYFSLFSITKILAAHDLKVYDVDELPTHGGSLRIYATPQSHDIAISYKVAGVWAAEETAGLHSLDGYANFQPKVEKVKRDLLSFLINAKEQGKTVAGYGAPGKGNTLLNYAGIRTDLVSFTVDRNPYKHGRFTPGTSIPIYAPERLDAVRPDYIVIIPWNLKEEISTQLAYTAEWGTKLVVAIPQLQVFTPGES